MLKYVEKKNFNSKLCSKYCEREFHKDNGAFLYDYKYSFMRSILLCIFGELFLTVRNHNCMGLPETTFDSQRFYLKSSFTAGDNLQAPGLNETPEIYNIQGVS